MGRSLRPRKSQPNYAELAGEAAAGPSIPFEDPIDSGSDFSPDKANAAADDDDDDDDDDDGDASNEEPEVGEEVVTAMKVVPSISKGKAKAKPAPKNLARAMAGPVTSGRRKMYTLPAPSVNHRHRATPLFSRQGKVERLVHAPKLFGPNSVALTNNFTHSSHVADRVNRAWGYNVGHGPLWQMVEDRRWFKEARGGEEDGQRRPRVYHDVPLKEGWRILDRKQGAVYLPTANETTEDGSFKAPPPISCLFGPIASQVRREVDMGEAFPLSEYIPMSKSYILNAGAPVWAMDWCPIHADDRAARSFKQYLAVAPFPNSSHTPEIGRKVKRPLTSCIQIWELSAEGLKCNTVLCIDGGPALDLKWCPLPSHDPVDSLKQPRKLGLLGGTFEDGSFSVYVVPDIDSTPDGPVLVQLEPHLRIELAEAACWSFDWANSETIAIGTTNGVIAIYNIGHAITTMNTKLRPTHYLNVHQSAIRSLAWIQAPPCDGAGVPRLDEDPPVIASGGYDGVECLTDIREGRGFIMNRTRDVINTLTFSPFAGGPVTMDHENTVKSYAASPSMLGRGHTLLEPLGPVWAANASEYHPQLAVVAADGSCSTTNMLRSPRRGGTVPFFVHKIYHLDYNRHTKEYRMLDCFLPQEVPDSRAASTAKKAPPTPSGTGAWPKHVGVHCVRWNNGNGLASSGLLASATASGLCRIDSLWGRWHREKPPYGGIEQIRMDDGEGMDVDSDGSDMYLSDA